MEPPNDIRKKKRNLRALPAAPCTCEKLSACHVIALEAVGATPSEHGGGWEWNSTGITVLYMVSYMVFYMDILMVCLILFSWRSCCVFFLDLVGLNGVWYGAIRMMWDNNGIIHNNTLQCQAFREIPKLNDEMDVYSSKTNTSIHVGFSSKPYLITGGDGWQCWQRQAWKIAQPVQGHCRNRTSAALKGVVPATKNGDTSDKSQNQCGLYIHLIT